MAFYSKKSPFSLNMDHEETKTIQSSSPTHHDLTNNIKTTHDQDQMCDDHDHQDLQFSPSSPADQYSSSPWTFFPLQSPSPSLLYHCIASLHRHEGNIYSIAVSKGTVFTGSESNRIRAWRRPDCLERGYLKASSGQVRAILTYGNILFTSHRDCKIRIWNFTVNSDNFRARRVSNLPKRSFFSSLKLTNTTTQLLQVQHKDCVSCMAYYHQEGLLYTGSYDKTVKVWRVLDKKCIDSFVAHETNVNAIVVNRDDGCVFTCSSDGSVKIWRRVYKENSHTLTMILKLIQQSPVNALALSSLFNDCFLYSGSSDGTINFWEKEKISSRFNHGGVLQGHRFGVLCLVAIGKLIFSGSEDTTIRVWKREQGSFFHDCLAVLDGHRGPVRCLVACLEMEKVVMGFLVYSASLDHTLKVWRVKVMADNDEKMWLNDCSSADRSDSKTKNMEYEISPVLSPSWVEKKRQGNHFR